MDEHRREYFDELGERKSTKASIYVLYVESIICFRSFKSDRGNIEASLSTMATMTRGSSQRHALTW